MSYCFGNMDMVRRPRPTEWSPEETEKLRQLAREGLTQQEAAERLGRKVRSVSNKVRQLKLPWPGYKPWSNSEIATLRKYARTKTTSEIATMLGRTHASVMNMAGRLGVSLLKYGENCNWTKFPSSQIAEMFRLRTEGWTQQRIASHLGVSRRHVKSVLNFHSRWRESVLLEHATQTKENLR